MSPSFDLLSIGGAVSPSFDLLSIGGAGQGRQENGGQEDRKQANWVEGKERGGKERSVVRTWNSLARLHGFVAPDDRLDALLLQPGVDAGEAGGGVAGGADLHVNQ